jgi:pilus assembly protein CpaF
MSDPMIRPIAAEPTGTPPQRGFIERNHARKLQAMIRIATMMGEKILGISDPLNKEVERTPDRELKVETALRMMARGGQIKIGSTPVESVIDKVFAELFGFGPLDRFIRSEEVTEIMVNGPWIIFIERGGKIVETGHKFLDDAHVERIIQRIVRPLGRDVGPFNPLVDARLPDGSRVNAAVAPCTLDGPSLTIRKFSRNKLSLDDLVRSGGVTKGMSDFLKAIVKARLNIVVSGGTGSGKTTLINALSEYIQDDERVVTIEDAAELNLTQRNVVRMECKKPSIDNPIEITMRDCLVNALRMRPERILIGECRGPEALDMLQAMNTGHDGSMTTVHANTPRDSVSRLETLALMGGLGLPLSVIRKQIASAVHFIVQTARMRDGSRKITYITEVQGMEGEVITLTDLFVYRETGMEGGRVIGAHSSSGVRPRCLVELERQGIKLPNNVFHQGAASREVKPRSGGRSLRG